MMKNKRNLITLVLILCFIVNVFIPKAIFNSDMADTFSQALKCQSSVLYYASISTFALTLLNKFIASELGLSVPKETSPKTQTKDQDKKNSSEDNNIFTSQQNLLTKTTFSRFINPVYSLTDVLLISREFTFFHGSGFWLYIHCVLLLCVFFLLPRGAIDNYSLLTFKCLT